jgi:hypothetical protein
MVFEKTPPSEADFPKPYSMGGPKPKVPGAASPAAPSAAGVGAGAGAGANAMPAEASLPPLPNANGSVNAPPGTVPVLPPPAEDQGLLERPRSKKSSSRVKLDPNLLERAVRNRNIPR